MISSGRLGADFVAHDADWQTPAITELHAFRRATALLPKAPGSVYLAFPWATLIDQIVHKRDASRLRAALAEVARAVAGATRIVTVCQHIFMRDFPELFAEAGVTDIFWSHQRRDGGPPGFAAMAVHPFPLYPVNSPGPVAASASPCHLFSFIGARPTELYLDSARTMIFDELADSPLGCVRDRADWHFYRDVYEKQIYQQPGLFEDPLATPEAVEYRTVMADSLFALCPTGTGPNSLRLWEAIDAGVIPVILSPLYLPPGDPWLWTAATISADATRDNLRALPQRLARIAADETGIATKRAALARLRARYGVDVFVHDIVELYRSAVPGSTSLAHHQGDDGAVDAAPGISD